MNQWIGVLDCNNFFVSCERLFRPDLHDKPVVVLSSNDGCVVARSQEVKDMNVPMGVPYFKIKDTLKEEGTAVFSSHFALYRDVSRRVFSVMRDVLGEVQQYSIDEAFFTISSEPVKAAWELKSVVERQVGIPVSIGLASTKTLAKHANSLAKKGSGVAVLSDEEWLKNAPEVPLSTVWGVGGKLEIKYKSVGLTTAADLIALDRDRVQTLFGVSGLRLQAELSGQSVYEPEIRLEPQKSIMSSRSFGTLVEEKMILEDAVAYHVRHAAADLRAMNSLATKIRVFIRASNHGNYFLRGGSKESILTIPSNDTIELIKIASKTVSDLYEHNVPYKKAGIVLSGLLPAGSNQRQLFTENCKTDNSSLLVAVDRLNEQSGRELVTMGTRLRTKQWQTRRESRSPAYTTQWSDLAKVKAK
tara:strand:+ start:78 stop:1325 length:1248 start_codon:yes stop_codon:yes gene_type:complete